jgi:hypothetical protein
LRATAGLAKQLVRGINVWGTALNQLDQGFDYPRYRKLLAEAVDEQKRLAFIQILIEERARERLAAHISGTIIRTVLGSRDMPDDAARGG